MGVPVGATAIEAAWAWLREAWWYRSVFFETFLVPVVSAFYYAAFLWLSRGRKHDARSRYDMRSGAEAQRFGALNEQGRGPGALAYDVFTYMTPLLVLDMLTRKRYPGHTSDDEWKLHPYVGWQVPLGRPLPVAAPTAANLLFAPVAALVLYDGVFYFLHSLLHRVPALRDIHFHHHDHDKLTWATTNQLTIIERVSLVLLANETLKMVSAHPLSRTLFVVYFLGALMESHCNLDLPLGADKIFPLYGGARSHVTHHSRFTCNYAPFFTWMDQIFGTASPCATPRCLVASQDAVQRGMPYQPPRSWFWDDLLAIGHNVEAKSVSNRAPTG